jgi:hypothetical protein
LQRAGVIDPRRDARPGRATRVLNKDGQSSQRIAATPKGQQIHQTPRLESGTGFENGNNDEGGKINRVLRGFRNRAAA